MTILGSARVVYADWLRRTGAGTLRWSLVFLLMLLAAGQWAPRLGFMGGVLGIAMFVTTLSFLLTTPNLGDGAGFLLKDFTLLGAATWLAGEAAMTVARET